MELRAYLSYRRKKLPLNYWRSKNGHEVDFLLGNRTAIEVRASEKISRNDYKGLKYLNEEGVFQNLILVSGPDQRSHRQYSGHSLAKVPLRPVAGPR